MEIAATSSLELYHRVEELEADSEELRYASTAVGSNARDLAEMVGEQGERVYSLSLKTDEVSQQASDCALIARSEVDSLAARVGRLESAEPLEAPGLLFLAAVSVGVALLTIGIIYLILLYVRNRRRRREETRAGERKGKRKDTALGV